MRKFWVVLSEFKKWDYIKQKSYLLGYMYNTRDNGETQIICKSKPINLAEVNSILGLLHPQYDDLGMTINIHRSKYYTFLKWINPFYTSIDKNTFKGAYDCVYSGNHNQGRIDLFPYNYKLIYERHESEIIRLSIVYDILHEVRHAYQRIYKEKKYIASSKNYVTGGVNGYSEQWIERDANAFAQRMMNNNKEKINKILGIEFSWDCTWGVFDTQRKIGTGKQMHPVDVLEAAKEGKKLRKSYWSNEMYIEMNEDGFIINRGEGWARLNTTYFNFYSDVYSGRWTIVE